MKYTIILTGGGSGGHITPVLAVAEALKNTGRDLKLVYIGQKGDNLGDIPAKHEAIDEVYSIRAGKFRRYHGEGWKQLLDVKTMALNFRDFFFVIIGFFQARKLIKTLGPSAVFIKGGFVGVPVGLAAAQLHVPYITHDSDAIPGLANKLISRWATIHAVALPKEVYSYPADKTVSTGIPLRKEFVSVDNDLNKQYRAKIGIPLSAKLLFVVGGGLGSQRVNAAVAQAVPHLLAEFPSLHVVHVAGRLNEADIRVQYEKDVTPQARKRITTLGFTDDMYLYGGAADLVITRAGATNLAEFSVQGKACVIIPSPFLTGGHQLKNAKYLEEQGAAIVIPEDKVTTDPNRLAKEVSELLSDDNARRKLAQNMHAYSKTHAANDIAKLLINTAKLDPNKR